MKTNSILVLIVASLLAIPSLAAGTTWLQAVDELSGINYDNDWEGQTPAGQRCRIYFDMAESDGTSSVQIDLMNGGQYKRERWAKLPDTTPFVYTGSNRTAHLFTQKTSQGSRFQFSLKIEYLGGKQALVALKLAPNDKGASCIVPVY